MPAPLLAFDSSTEALAIGVDGPRGPICWNGPGGAQASATLVPQLRAMLAQHGLAIGDLGAIAFGAGPGAFTGLRTACSVAQGLALGAGIPVVPIDSLQIVAEDARMQGGGGDIGVAMDARMGEVYAARYRWDGRCWATMMPPCLCRPEALTDAWRHAGPTVLAGTGMGLLDQAAVEGRRCLPMLDRAQALLSLARRRFDAGAAVDAGAALPLYVRDKVAQTTAERTALATSKTPLEGAAP